MSKANKTFIWKNRVWVETKVENIVAGDVFRGYKGNGHPIRNKYGGVAFLAMTDCKVKEFSEEEMFRNGNRHVREMTIDTWTKEKYGMLFKL